jgi:hypothetical protein
MSEWVFHKETLRNSPRGFKPDSYGTDEKIPCQLGAVRSRL